MVGLARTTHAKPTWTTPCCERIPVHVHGYKWACCLCGQLVYDTAAEVRVKLGPGVERAIGRRVEVLGPDD